MRMTEEQYAAYQERNKSLEAIAKKHGLPGPKAKKTNKPSKYRNQRIEVDGEKFDSKGEYQRYCELQMMERAGEIKELKRQVPFELIPKVKIDGKTRPAVKYVADFTYTEAGYLVVEDFKSSFTRKNPVYRIKRHLMKHVMGIEITEVAK